MKKILSLYMAPFFIFISVQLSFSEEQGFEDDSYNIEENKRRELRNKAKTPIKIKKRTHQVLEKEKESSLRSIFIPYVAEGKGKISFDSDLWKRRRVTHGSYRFVNQLVGYSQELNESRLDFNLKYDHGITSFFSMGGGIEFKSRKTDYTFTERVVGDYQCLACTVTPNHKSLENKIIYRSSNTQFPIFLLDPKLHLEKEWLHLYIGAPIKYSGQDFKFERNSVVGFWNLENFVVHPYLVLSTLVGDLWRFGFKSSYSFLSDRNLEFINSTTRYKVSAGNEARFDFFNEFHFGPVNPVLFGSFVIQFPWRVSASTNNGDTFGEPWVVDGFRAWVIGTTLPIKIFHDVAIIPHFEWWMPLDKKVDGSDYVEFKKFNASLGLQIDI